MKHLKTTLTLLLLFGMTSYIFGAYAQNETVEKLHELYTNTIDNSNLDNLDVLYTKDVTIRNSDGSITSGLENLKAQYKMAFASGTYKIILKTSEATALDIDHMFVSGTYVYSKIDEPKGVLKGEFVNTLKNINGQWKIYKSYRYQETTNNATMVNELYKAFAKGDIPVVLAAMDADIVWNEAEGNVLANGNPYIGPDAVLNGVFAKLPNDFENFSLENIVLTEMSNNQVLATLRYKATSVHNGKKLDAQVAHVWTINEGKITAFQQYADTKQLDEMMKK